MIRRAAVVALIAFAGCTPAAQGTVTGDVSAGPTCPVEREGESCPDKQLAGATVIVHDEDGKTITEVPTAADGSYSVKLRVATYNVTARSDEAMSCDSYFVNVEADETKKQDISCDTGIR